MEMRKRDRRKNNFKGVGYSSGRNRLYRQAFSPKKTLSSKQTAIKTTLYELIGAINEEIPPQDDR